LVDAERGGDSLEEVVDDGDDVAIAAITVAELRVGVQLAHVRQTTVATQRLIDAIEPG